MTYEQMAANWKAGFETGLESPIMKAMSIQELSELAHAHRQCGTYHDFGMAAACMVLARAKAAGRLTAC